MMRLIKSQNGSTVLVVMILLSLALILRWTTEVPHPGYGFVLTLEYTGQMVAGLRALLSQQCWISSFSLPLVIVEPFANGSLLRNSHQLWSEHNDRPIAQFRDLFDLEHFNEQSRMAGNPELVSWEHFYNSAPRNLIVVTITDIHHESCLQFSEQMCAMSMEKELNFFAPCSIPDETQPTLQNLQRNNFVIVRNVCMNCLEEFSGLTPDAINEHIFGSHKPQDVTVIFNRWRFSMKVTKDCKDVETCSNENTVLPQIFIDSEKLQNDANWYIETYLPSQLLISIMIRVEWHFITNRKDEDRGNNAIECLQQVLDTVSGIKKMLGDSKIPSFLSMDVGTFGSGTFKNTIRKTGTSESMYTDVINHAKTFVQQLYHSSWKFEDWERSFLAIPGLLHDKGYIAALQRTIASRGDCLILMGGGHFQHMALQTYLRRHPEKSEQCIKYVCVAPPFKRLFGLQ